MRKSYLITGLTLTGIIVTLCTIAIIKIPSIAKGNAEKLFYESGFDASKISEPSMSFGNIRYQNIELDRDGFSTIKSLKIEYSFFGLLFFNQTKKIEIDGLNLTGEINNNQRITISGWSPQEKHTLLPSLYNTKSISIKNAQISLLSENHGGISISGELDTIKNNHGIAFRGKLVNTQKHMRYSSKFDGQLNNNESWTSDIEIEDIRLDLPHLKATRASGEIKISADREREPELIGELRAGNMTIAGFPWKNTSITLQGNPGTPTATIGAKTPSFETIELGLGLENIYDANKLSGYIFTENLKDFFNYLEQHSALPLKRENLKQLENLNGTEINFDKNNNDIEFNIRNEELQLDLNGFTQLARTSNEQLLPNIAIESNKPGKLEIKNLEFFDLIENKKDKKLLEKALSDLNYSKLVITILNQKKDIFKFKFEIVGKSQNVNNGRILKTHFTITSDLDTIAKSLLSN